MSKKKSKPIIAGVCIVAVAAVAATVVVPNLNAKGEDTIVSKETEVKYGSLVTGITESGSLEIGSVSQTFDDNWTGSSTSSSTGSSGTTETFTSKTSQSATGQQSGSIAGGSMGSVSVSGNNSGSSSATSTSIASSSSDEISLEIEKVCVSAGQVVSEGDVLYTLTEESVSEAKSILKEQVTSAELALKEAEYEKEAALLEAKYELESNQLLGTTAKTEYDATIKELQSQVDSARTALDEADERIAAIPKEITALKKKKSSSTSTGSTEGSSLTSGTTQNVVSAASVDSNGKSQNGAASNGMSSGNSQSTGSSTSTKTSNDSQSSDIDGQITALQTELSNLKKNYSQLEANLEKAKANLSQGKVTAQQIYDESMLTYENAKTTYDIAVESVDDSLEDAEEALEEAQKQWKAFKNTIGDGEITAEYSGTITSLGCEKGDTLSSGIELATYTDTEAVTLTVSVSQEDIAKAQVGDAVDIVFTAYEDKTYEGTVTEISTSANSSSTVSYDVTVTVNGDIEGLYAGMTGSVTFITKKVENVTYVSNKAITAEGTKSYVKRKNGDTTETVEVTTGFSDGTSVEITDGLEAGDIVLIESQVKSK